MATAEAVKGTGRRLGLIAARWVRPIEPADLGETGDAPVQVLAGPVLPHHLAARGLEVVVERDLTAHGRWVVYVLGTRRVVSLTTAAAGKYLEAWRKSGPGRCVVMTRKPEALAARRRYLEGKGVVR